MSVNPILIVEDEPDIREYMAMLFESEGYTVYTAANGQLALDILRDPTKPLPRLVALDLQMPVMDGRGFLEQLPALERDLSGMSVVLVTASEPSSRRDLEGKTIAVLRKPLDIEDLLAAAAKYCGKPKLF